MKKGGSRWVMTLLRAAVCVAAIIYLVFNVSWRDHVTLADEQQSRVRLIEERPHELVIERDGQRRTIDWDQVRQVTVGGEQVPDIERGIPTVVRQVDKRMALFAILIFAPTWFIQSYRLVVMMKIQGVVLRYWNAVKLTYAGNFFNFALPGTTGGDLVKAYYVSKYTNRKTEVVTTVFLDRAIGLFSVVLLAAGGILVRWDPDEFAELIVALLVLFAGLGIGAIMIFSTRIRTALGLSALAERLPMGQQLLRIGRATVEMRHHKLRVLSALGLSLALQSIVIVSASVMATEALGMRGALSYYFIYVAIGFLVAAIPITPPQGLGVMEAAYVEFFTNAGLADASQAVALALAVRLTQLVYALPGVLVPLLGAHLPSQAELATLEQEAAEQTGDHTAAAANHTPATGTPATGPE